ncbi:MAG: NUDIX hydrolase [Acidimicrobiales bacterium]|jgi:ADP-ribose pyrophosphatase
MGENKFVVEDSRVVHEGKIVSTEILSVRTPDGDLVERQVVRHPGAVAVVAIHDGCVVLVEQYRAALDDTLIEIPAGKTDIPGEFLETAARRELIEEVGLDPQSLVFLGDFITAAGFCDEALTIFASNDCIEVSRQVDGVEEEYSEILRIPLAEVDGWLTGGRLRDAKSLIGLFWARDLGLLAPSA